MLKYPFEVPFDEMRRNMDAYVSSVFSSLAADFLVMPKGRGFIEYPVFERAYEALKRATTGFTALSPEKILAIVKAEPLSLVVLRTMLGFTPSEWAAVASERTGTEVSQGFARSLDRKVRLAPDYRFKGTEATATRLSALVQTACELLLQGAPDLAHGMIHRLDKADTKSGPDGLRRSAGMGVPYAMLLYERFLGRPFAVHRDSVSGLIGEALESAIEDVLSKGGISFRKTKRAERVEGFDQAPDFIVPSEFNPRIVIEAKICRDDGTARDKVTRVQHLAELSMAGQPPGRAKYQVIACIGGRGFAVRREDMKRMLLATRGKVFTLETLSRLIDCTQLRDFQAR